MFCNSRVSVAHAVALGRPVVDTKNTDPRAAGWRKQINTDEMGILNWRLSFTKPERDRYGEQSAKNLFSARLKKHTKSSASPLPVLP